MNPTTRAYLMARRDLHLTPLGVSDCQHTFQAWCDAGFPDADEPAPGEYFGVCPDSDDEAVRAANADLRAEAETLAQRLGQAERALAAAERALASRTLGARVRRLVGVAR